MVEGLAAFRLRTTTYDNVMSRNEQTVRLRKMTTNADSYRAGMPHVTPWAKADLPGRGFCSRRQKIRLNGAAFAFRPAP